jgi:hypothetical protein
LIIPPIIVLSEDDDNVKGTSTAEDLREKARRMKCDEQEEHKRAKRARKKKDYHAEAVHKRDALARKCAIERLNKEAARVIFSGKNKVQRSITPMCHGQAR